MSSLPIGWEDRSNRMSEKDMKLGGIAATKFANKNLTTKNSYEGDNAGIYQNSDQVRDHYLRQINQQQQSQAKDDSPFSAGNRHAGAPSSASTATTNTPMFWEERQKLRNLETEGFRSKTEITPIATARTSQVRSAAPTTNADAALVKVATYTLEQLADALEASGGGASTTISMEDRASFAKAIQRAMQALAKSKN